MSINPYEIQHQPAHDNMGEDAPKAHEVPPADFSGKPEEHQQMTSGIVQDALNRTPEKHSNRGRNIVAGIAVLAASAGIGGGIYASTRSSGNPESTRTTASGAKIPGTIPTPSTSQNVAPPTIEASPSQTSSTIDKYTGKPLPALDQEARNGTLDAEPWAVQAYWASSQDTSKINDDMSFILKSDVSDRFTSISNPSKNDSGQDIINDFQFNRAAAEGGFQYSKQINPATTATVNNDTIGMSYFKVGWDLSNPDNVRRLKNYQLGFNADKDANGVVRGTIEDYQTVVSDSNLAAPKDEKSVVAIKKITTESNDGSTLSVFTMELKSFIASDGTSAQKWVVKSVQNSSK